MESTAELLYQLKSSGHRMTVVRKMVVEIFHKSQAPLSAQDLIKLLTRKGKSVNKTTVYREIESLREANLIREVNLLDGQLRYELIKETENHSHLVCTQCKKIECLRDSGDLSLLKKTVLKNKRFSITHHVLEFFGICEECN